MPYSKKPKRTYKKKSWSRKTSKTSKGSLIKLIKNVSLKQSETKTSGLTYAGTALYHNVTYYQGNVLATKVGDQDESGFVGGFRVGDEVIARGVAFKFHLSNSITCPNVIYKVFVFRYSTALLPITDATFWCGIDGVGGNMDRIVDMPNSERVKVLKSFTIQHQPNYCNVINASGGAINRNTSTLRQVYVPLNNTKLKYNADGSNFPRWTDIGVAVLAYDMNSTLQTDIRGYMTYSHKFYYKDP